MYVCDECTRIMLERVWWALPTLGMERGQCGTVGCVVVVATVSMIAVVRTVVLGDTVVGYYGENECVEGYSIVRCDVEGC